MVWQPSLKQALQGKGGKGGGWGGKGWCKPTKNPSLTVPDDFQVDTEARYSGTVTSYKKFSGFGFITMTEKGIIPEDLVYVHWRNIQTEDRFPTLIPGMEIEFGLLMIKDKTSGLMTLKAKTVTLPGGGSIAVQEEIDASKREFVGGQHLRYTGTLQYFSAKRGFGWITMDDGYELTEPVPNELRVDVQEVNAGGKQPGDLKKDLQVEFGIVKGKTNGYKAYNMTLPGGVPITHEGLEHRQFQGMQTFTGTVVVHSKYKGWGFIKCSDGTILPPNVITKIQQMHDATAAKGKDPGKPEDMVLYFRKIDIQPGADLQVGQAVTFKVYTDDKGAGACEIC